MKQVIAIIPPHKVDEVREALLEIGVAGMTTTEVKGYGRQKGHTELFRGAEYVVQFVDKARLEILVAAPMLERLLETLVATVRTGKIGDGKIFVCDTGQVLRVRTGESGEGAI